MTTSNVKRFIIERASQISVERAKQRYGSCGAGAMVQHIADGGLQDSLREAAKWVQDALKVARQAPGSECWPTDEDMAGEILRLIQVRRGK